MLPSLHLFTHSISICWEHTCSMGNVVEGEAPALPTFWWDTCCGHPLATTKFSRSRVLKTDRPWAGQLVPSGACFNTPDSTRRLIKTEAHLGWWVNICRWFIPFNSSSEVLSLPLFTHLAVNASMFSFTGLGPYAVEEFWLFQTSSVFQDQLWSRAIIYSLLFSLWWRHKNNSYFLPAGQLNVMTL